MHWMLLICTADKIFNTEMGVYATSNTPKVGDAPAPQKYPKHIKVADSRAAEKPRTIDFSHQLCT